MLYAMSQRGSRRKECVRGSLGGSIDKRNSNMRKRRYPIRLFTVAVFSHMRPAETKISLRLLKNKSENYLHGYLRYLRLSRSLTRTSRVSYPQVCLPAGKPYLEVSTCYTCRSSQPVPILTPKVLNITCNICLASSSDRHAYIKFWQIPGVTSCFRLCNQNRATSATT